MVRDSRTVLRPIWYPTLAFERDLSDESRQMLLQLLSRRKTPEPAEGAPPA